MNINAEMVDYILDISFSENEYEPDDAIPMYNSSVSFIDLLLSASGLSDSNRIKLCQVKISVIIGIQRTQNYWKNHEKTVFPTY